MEWQVDRWSVLFCPFEGWQGKKRRRWMHDFDRFLNSILINGVHDGIIGESCIILGDKNVAISDNKDAITTTVRSSRATLASKP